MKKIHIIAACFLGLLSLFSCKDFLDVKPSNVQSMSSFSDVKALMGAHLRMYERGGKSERLENTNVFFFNNEDYLITHFYSDDYDVNRYFKERAGQAKKDELRKSIDWKNPDISERIWSTHFQNIGFYNMIVGGLKQYPDDNIENTQRVAAEAKILRAWQIFRLLQFFSPYHNNELGIPLNTDAEKVGDYDRSRKTQKEVYKFIIDELNEVLSYTAEPSPTYNIFYDKNIVHALLAEIYLWKGDSGAKADGDYQHAIEHAQAAIKNRLENGVSIYNRAAQPATQLGWSKKNPYSLISFVYPDPIGFMMACTSGFTTWGMYQYPSEELYKTFENVNDKRFYKYFKYGNNAINKFSPGIYTPFYKWDFFTAPEMQLIIAESYARMNNEAEAEKALKVFTEGRYMPSYIRPEGKSLLDCILLERRKEFCFEYCMRWLDLTRLQKGWKRIVITEKGDGYGTEEEKDKEYILEDGDYRFCMPIPKVAELKHNKIKQNPGWENF